MAKEIKLTESDEFKARDVLLSVVENAAVGHGFTFRDMRRRLRIVDVIRAADGPDFVLEDEDYNGLKDILENFNGFLGGKQMTQLVRMHDEVLAAKAPSKKEGGKDGDLRAD